MNRRTLIETSSLTLLAACSSVTDTTSISEHDTSVEILPEYCTETTSQQEGPYYVPTLSNTVDMTEGATSNIVSLSCTLVDTDCNPISGAKIDIWHADASGQYDLTSEQRIHYGYVTTNEHGEFSMRTILPGAYLNGPNVYRPRHYHIKIWIQNTEFLTTQLYFEGDEFLVYEPNTPQELMLTLAENSEGWSTSYQFVVQI